MVPVGEDPPGAFKASTSLGHLQRLRRIEVLAEATFADVRTRVFANQAGYSRNGVRENQGFRPDRVIEVSAADEAKEAVTDVSRRGR